jgi:hypothetical protein
VLSFVPKTLRVTKGTPEVRGVKPSLAASIKTPWSLIRPSEGPLLGFNIDGILFASLMYILRRFFRTNIKISYQALPKHLQKDKEFFLRLMYRNVC